MLNEGKPQEGMLNEGKPEEGMLNEGFTVHCAVIVINKHKYLFYK
jgi:hypothetical protein